MAKNSKNWTQKEIGVSLNNALVAVNSQASILGIDELRKKKLRHYLMAALEPIVELVQKGYLTAEELVVILQSGALFVYVFMAVKKK